MYLLHSFLGLRNLAPNMMAAMSGAEWAIVEAQGATKKKAGKVKRTPSLRYLQTSNNACTTTYASVHVQLSRRLYASNCK